MVGKNSQNDPSLYLKNSKRQKKKEETRPYKKFKITDLTKGKEGKCILYLFNSTQSPTYLLIYNSIDWQLIFCSLEPYPSHHS